MLSALALLSKSSSRKSRLLAYNVPHSNPGTRYPETCGKTLEEVEELFGDNGPKPWHTKPGQSKLDSLIAEAREKHLHVKDVAGATHTENVNSTEAGHNVGKAVVSSGGV